MSARRIIVCLCVAVAVAGCHLVDQRDFDADAGRPPKPRVLPPGPPPPPALVTIRYTTPEPQYRDRLAALVARALARKRDVLFTVTSSVPEAASPEEAASSGHEVAQAIVDDGAEAGQVEQAVRLDPAITVKEVTVNVH
jgi:hypothetical protein